MMNGVRTLVTPWFSDFFSIGDNANQAADSPMHDTAAPSVSKSPSQPGQPLPGVLDFEQA